MSRRAGVYSLILRRDIGYWYFRWQGEKTYRSTGARDRHWALVFLLDEFLKNKPDREKARAAFLEELQRSDSPDYYELVSIGSGETKSAEILRTSPARRSLKEYSADFFVWDRCPHCRKLREEGRQITKRHAHHQRLTMLKHLIGDPDKNIPADPIAEKPLQQITRADVLDYRARLAAKLPDKTNTANKALAVLKTILKEAYFREDISRDPTLGVGNLKETRKEAGIFTAAELLELFPVVGLGPWKNLQTKDVFLVAASTGLRRGEILALRWKHVDLGNGIARINEAWKGGDETGTPKWGRRRVAPLPPVTVDALRELWERRPPQLATPDNLVFCYIDGSRLGGTWWQKAFTAAMTKAKINARARGIKAHSFRHTVATLRRDAGEDPAKIRAALGWSNERTQEGYEHFTPEMLRSEILENLFDTGGKGNE